MNKLRSQIGNIVCVALLLFFGVFLACHFFSSEEPAFADDGTPLRVATDEFFVTIYDQGSELIVKTGAATVAEILARSEIILAETDSVEPALDAVVDSDFYINIYRSRPVLITDGAVKRYLMTASYDPKQIALEAGFTVYDGDTFTTELNANFLETGAASAYRLTRNGGRTITVEETLAYATETRYDFTLDKGITQVEQYGEDGRRVSVYQVNFEDNVEVSRELVSEEIVVAAVPEILIVGAKVSVPPEYAECAAWIREAGVSELDLEAALDLVYRESGCRVDATNPSSGAYGIPQALPGNKMAEIADDWQTNPVTQIRWMAQYVEGRYGGWQPALDFWWCTGVCSSKLGAVNKNGYWY